MKEMKKVRVELRLAPGLREKLKDEKQKTGKTETGIVEEALIRYFDQREQDRFIELFLEKFEERYGNMFTRIQLAAGTADRNVQSLLNIKNTELFFNGLRPEHFMSMYETEHGVVSASEKSVREQIAKSKQYKDNSKVDE